MKPKLSLVGFFVTMALVHALVAFWTPVSAEDWGHWVWNAQHGDEGAVAWLRAHLAFSDAIGYVLARYRSVHAIVSPAVGAALVVGLFVLAMRRLPRATWQDVLGVALVSALIWIAQPHPGVAWFHTPSVAMQVYGAAVAVWFVAPFRCGWQVPRAAWPVLAIAGYCVGTSTRAIATLVGLVLVVRALPRDRRARWMWIALGGLVVGVAVGYARPPWIEFARIFKRGLEPNLILMKLPIEEAGKLVSLVAALVLADLALGAFGRSRAAADARPDAADTSRWLVAWFATAVWCLFGPKYFDATLLPATCLIVIAGLPYLVWLATSRVLRYAIIALVVGVHAIAWPFALVTYHRFGGEGFTRMEALQLTPPGEVAHVKPYSQILSNAWFFGEDLATTQLRNLVAIEAFGLRDLMIAPPFRRLETNPGIAITLDIDGVTDAELRAAKVPAVWGGVVAVARDQFELFVKRLRAITDKPISARLVVTNVAFAERGARPLLAAWVDRTGTMIPKTAISNLDEQNQVTIRIYGTEARQFKDAWIVDGGVARSTPYRYSAVVVQPMTARLNVVVACNPDRCLVVDALVPRF